MQYIYALQVILRWGVKPDMIIRNKEHDYRDKGNHIKEIIEMSLHLMEKLNWKLIFISS